MPIISLTKEQLDELLGAVQSAVELSHEDDKRIARAPESDGYTEEDVEHARAYTATLEATQAALKQAAEQAEELAEQVEKALGDAIAYRLGDDDLNEGPSEPDDVEPYRKHQALAKRLDLHPWF